MLPEEWKVRRAIAIRLGSLEDVVLTIPRLQELRQSLPSAAITLMTSYAISQPEVLSWVDDVLVHEGTLFTSNTERELALIKTLSSRAFDAAVIFTNDGESPYPLAYICYLAGIPLRLGRSLEFGGSVLGIVQTV